MCIDVIKSLTRISKISDFSKPLAKLKAHIPNALGVELQIAYPIEIDVLQPKNFYENDESFSNRVTPNKEKIEINQENIGALTVYSDGQLSKNDSEILSIVAVQIGTEVQNLIFRNAIKEVTEPISLQLRPDEYADNLASVLRKSVSADYTIIRRKDGAKYKIAGYSGLTEMEDRSELAIGHGFEPELKDFLDKFLDADIQLETDGIFLAGYKGNRTDLVAASRRVFNDGKISCFLTTPLMVGGSTTGIITFLFRRDDIVGVFDKSLMMMLTNHCAVALENYLSAQAVEQIRVSQLVEFVQATNFELVNGLRHSAVNNMYILANRLKGLEKNLRNFDKQKADDPFNLCLEYSSRLNQDLNKMELIVKDRYRHVWEEVDLRALFSKAIDKVSDNFTDSKRKRIPINIQSSELKLYCIPDAIIYAFVNILLNSKSAIRSTKHGRSHRVSFVGRKVGDYLEIDISDTGIGIPLGKGDIVKAQDIFDGGTTTKPDGTGWGLRMAQSVFQELHEGTISVKQLNPATLRVQLNTNQKAPH